MRKAWVLIWDIPWHHRCYCLDSLLKTRIKMFVTVINLSQTPALHSSILHNLYPNLCHNLTPTTSPTPALRSTTRKTTYPTPITPPSPTLTPSSSPKPTLTRFDLVWPDHYSNPYPDSYLPLTQPWPLPNPYSTTTPTLTADQPLPANFNMNCISISLILVSWVLTHHIDS